MPLEVSDDLERSGRWLVFGTDRPDAHLPAVPRKRAGDPDTSRQKEPSR